MPVAVLEPEELKKLVREAVREALAEAGTSDVLSTSQAARIADRNEDTIREWIASGELAANKRGKVWAIKRADLDRYLAGEEQRADVSTQTLLASIGSRK